MNGDGLQIACGDCNIELLNVTKEYFRKRNEITKT